MSFELLDHLIPGEDWQSLANCQGVDPDLFFPQRGASVREAKAVCSMCKVQEQCLTTAINRGEKFGIWGGASERQRRAIRRQRKADIAQREECGGGVPSDS